MDERGPARSKAARISATQSRLAGDGGERGRAATTLATFDVECDWRLVAALMTSEGPIIQPTRQPVMA